MTHDRSMCFHEGLADCSGSPLHLKKKMECYPSQFRGNADTGMIHDSGAILQMFPDCPVVVLTGASLSWNVFAQKKGLSTSTVDIVNVDYKTTKERLKTRALFVDVHKLVSDVGVARELWQHCMQSGRIFDEMRWEMLRHLNVQVKPENLAQRLGL